MHNPGYIPLFHSNDPTSQRLAPTHNTMPLKKPAHEERSLICLLSAGSHSLPRIKERKDVAALQLMVLCNTFSNKMSPLWGGRVNSGKWIVNSVFEFMQTHGITIFQLQRSGSSLAILDTTFRAAEHRHLISIRGHDLSSCSAATSP